MDWMKIQSQPLVKADESISVDSGKKTLIPDHLALSNREDLSFF